MVHLRSTTALIMLLSPTSYAFHNNIAKYTSTPRVGVPSSSIKTSSTSTVLGYSNWDMDTPDVMEIMAGGQRWEMVELPDSMMSTTLWVGNLCEFVTDETLSELFQSVSSLKFVPACVARRPNMESMRYGFVTFRSEEEKETAMNLLHGYELQGKCLKVEPIKDTKHGRIRAPQKIVDYCVGPIKRQRGGELNTMRRATTRTGMGDDDTNDDRVDRYRQDRAQRRARMEKRKTRGRYKNQQRKHSRATRSFA